MLVLTCVPVSHKGVEQIAVEMENPFGVESNDLPLDSLCLSLQADMLRLLDESNACIGE